MSDAQSNDKIWFYEEKGERKGPVSEDEMALLIQSTVLSNDSSVWKKGFPGWIEVKNSELNIHIDNSVPPPLTGNHVNNTIVWILAFAPIIGYFLEWVMAGMTSGGNQFVANLKMASDSYWFITLGLNIGLAYYDEKLLEKAGHNTKKFKGWTWLVPVYLYQRAQFLKQNYAYFIVWLVCFILVVSS